MNAFERVLDAFREHGLAVDERGDRANAQAPNHSSADRSVSIRRDVDKVLVHSHSDETETVLAALGLTWGDLYDQPRGTGPRLEPKPPTPEQVQRREERAAMDAAHAAERQRELDAATQTAAEVLAGNCDDPAVIGAIRRALDSAPDPLDADDDEPRPWAAMELGGSFILDQPAGIPALWGEGETVLWAEGEALLIGGMQGLGKTSLAGVLVAGMLGQQDLVLGLPVQRRKKILYLAMDRPRQAARALRRQLGHMTRADLNEHLVVWKGPPIADMAKSPRLLAEMCEAAGADVVIVDSLKDAAIGLSEDETGAGWNRARQIALAAGVQVMELHHIKKLPLDQTPTITDVYGSTWLTSGCGSVILLTGQPGDPMPRFFHVKAPAEQLGPWTLIHDQDAGTMEIQRGTDLVELARLRDGLTAKAAAVAVYETEKPSASDVQKVRRRLDKLVDQGLLVRTESARVTDPVMYLHAPVHSFTQSFTHPPNSEPFTHPHTPSRTEVEPQVTASREPSRASRDSASRFPPPLKRGETERAGSTTAKSGTNFPTCGTCQRRVAAHGISRCAGCDSDDRDLTNQGGNK